MKPLIIANWKMNPTTSKDVEHFIESFKKSVDIKNLNSEVVFCPPYLWLSSFLDGMGNSRQLSFGAQDCFWESKGAYTGEISPLMLKNMGCKYVIIGHSERRNYLGESDSIVNRKMRSALKHWLKPILCVGEKARDAFDASGRVINEASLTIAEQLEKGLSGISTSQVSQVVVAYEPVWAIGTGNACSPDDAMKSALYLRKILMKLYDRPTAEKVKIIYGGSVDSRNAIQYIKEANMNGLLVGGASLNASDFSRIVSEVL